MEAAGAPASGIAERNHAQLQRRMKGRRSPPRRSRWCAARSSFRLAVGGVHRPLTVITGAVAGVYAGRSCRTDHGSLQRVLINLHVQIDIFPLDLRLGDGRTVAGPPFSVTTQRKWWPSSAGIPSGQETDAGLSPTALTKACETLWSTCSKVGSPICTEAWAPHPEMAITATRAMITAGGRNIRFTSGPLVHRGRPEAGAFVERRPGVVVASGSRGHPIQGAGR